jgi:hypothetical protein
MKRPPSLYRVTRVVNDMTTLASGSPKRLVRRVKNHAVGRVLARAGFWRWLWK